MTIDKAGIYDLDDEAYFSDPCPTPSLSASIARTLLSQSPRHAWQEHPRLNPNHAESNSKAMDIGKVAHALVLEGIDKAEILDFPDYRTKDAKAARDAAYAAKKIPILKEKSQEIFAMADACRVQLMEHAESFGAFRDGKPEQAIIWQEPNGIWCRCRLDWLPNKGNIVHDYKTTTDASPDAFTRKIYDMGYDIQCAMYRRGLMALGRIEKPEFHFVAQETTAPYALSIVALSNAAQHMAMRKAENAIMWWKWCLDNNKWPGYVARVAVVDPPPYAERQWIEREEREALLRQDGTDIKNIMLNWQQPNKETQQ